MLSLTTLLFSVFFLAISFKFLPLQIMPFAFTSKILLNQHFLLPGLSLHYFAYVGLVLATTVIVSYFYPNHRLITSLLGSIAILLILNSLLSAYLVLTVLNVFWIGRFIKVSGFKTEFQKFMILWSLWAIWCVGIPWIGMGLTHEIDGIRLIFLHICALKVGTYLYDSLIREK